MARNANRQTSEHGTSGSRFKVPEATSAWGCLWRTVVFTLILLLVYLTLGYATGM